MVARSLSEVEDVWVKLNGVKKLSDGIIKIGPLPGIGLDGLTAALSAFPPTAPIGGLADAVFTAGTALYLFSLALKARASLGTMFAMAVYMAIDFFSDSLAMIPVIGFFVGWMGGLFDFLFQGQVLAARALQKEIERTHWIDGDWNASRENYEIHRAEMRAAGKRRMVFLKG